MRKHKISRQNISKHTASEADVLPVLREKEKMSNQLNHLHGLENTLYKYQGQLAEVDPDNNGIARAERKRLVKLINCYEILVSRQKRRIAQKNFDC